MAKIDLHIHSNCSDGSDSIEELIKIIQENNIEIFSLTDHDTTEGLDEMSKNIPSEVTFIKGIELTSTADTVNCHILGYNINQDSKLLQQLIEKGKKLRLEKVNKRVEFLKDKWNIILTKQESDWLYSRKSIVKTHIANILVNRGLSDNNVDAMKIYLDGCKTRNLRFTGEEAINSIKDAGGIPVWAHPLGGEGETHISKEVFFKQLDVMKNFGIQGLECYYSRYNMDEIEFLVSTAKENNLFITGGSDYHGKNKSIPIAKLNTDNLYIDSNKLSIS